MSKLRTNVRPARIVASPRASWWVSTLASCGVLLLVAGCHDAPAAFRADQLDSVSERRQHADAYWNRFGLPADLDLNGTRVVISEFVVEFVTEKRESGGIITKQQSRVHVPAGFIGVGIDASGVNRRVIEYDEALLEQVPDALYDAVAQVLRERGCDVVPAEQVIASSPYQELLSHGEDETPFLQRLNPIGSDTGRVIKAVFRPAKGLKIFAADDPAEVERVELALLDEFEADLSIRGRFRLGVFDERVSFDLGAIVLLTGPQLAGSVTSTRSLLSEAKVVAATEFVPVKGDVIALDEEAYRATLRELFPLFVSMGLDKADSDDVPHE